MLKMRVQTSINNINSLNHAYFSQKKIEKISYLVYFYQENLLYFLLNLYESEKRKAISETSTGVQNSFKFQDSF